MVHEYEAVFRIGRLASFFFSSGGVPVESDSVSWCSINR